MTRDEVMKEFGYDVLVSFVSPVVAESMRSLADEIVRLRGELRDMHTKVFHREEKLAWTERERDQLTSMPAERILAALREPTDHIIVSAYDELCLQDHENARYSLADTIRAAVAAAEREVANDAG